MSCSHGLFSNYDSLADHGVCLAFFIRISLVQEMLHEHQQLISKDPEMRQRSQTSKHRPAKKKSKQFDHSLSGGTLLKQYFKWWGILILEDACAGQT